MTLYSIPPELVLNADQTPSSYVSVGKVTMAAKGVKSVPVEGLTDKKNTFVVTFKGGNIRQYTEAKLKQVYQEVLCFQKGFL